ncbi:hypothetical protein QYF36_017041 [Acer negundo]|nr:hypothetical protein QYF36_017041 [Acer negundo]
MLAPALNPLILASLRTILAPQFLAEYGSKLLRLQSYKLQNLYQFSDFPWPSSVTEDFPTKHQVFDYIQSYAQHFDLLKHIRFNTKVVGIEYDQGLSDEEVRSWSSWNGNGQPFRDYQRKWKVYRVDFVIFCVGRFSDVTNIPEFPPKKGPEAFHGKVIHSMDYVAMDYESAANFVKGKLVTVVGLQKSALDIAMECTAANNGKPRTSLDSSISQLTENQKQ